MYLQTVCRRGHIEAVYPAAVRSALAVFGSDADFCARVLPDGSRCEAVVVESTPIYGDGKQQEGACVAWAGWITMRGDDREIDGALTNPRRRSALHLFPSAGDRRAPAKALCGARRPREDDHLGLVYSDEPSVRKCRRCLAIEIRTPKWMRPR